MLQTRRGHSVTLESEATMKAVAIALIAVMLPVGQASAQTPPTFMRASLTGTYAGAAAPANSGRPGRLPTPDVPGEEEVVTPVRQEDGPTTRLVTSIQVEVGEGCGGSTLGADTAGLLRHRLCSPASDPDARCPSSARSPAHWPGGWPGRRSAPAADRLRRVSPPAPCPRPTPW